MQSERLIETHEGLLKWQTELRSFHFRSLRGNMQINLSELTEEENKQANEVIHRYRRECGCRTGSYFMSFALVASIITYFFRGGTFSAIKLVTFGWLVGAMVIGAATGKLVGILNARISLIHLTEGILIKTSVNNRNKQLITNL